MPTEPYTIFTAGEFLKPGGLVFNLEFRVRRLSPCEGRGFVNATSVEFIDSGRDAKTLEYTYAAHPASETLPASARFSLQLLPPLRLTFS